MWQEGLPFYEVNWGGGGACDKTLTHKVWKAGRLSSKICDRRRISKQRPQELLFRDRL